MEGKEAAALPREDPDGAAAGGSEDYHPVTSKVTVMVLFAPGTV